MAFQTFLRIRITSFSPFLPLQHKQPLYPTFMTFKFPVSNYPAGNFYLPRLLRDGDDPDQTNIPERGISSCHRSELNSAKAQKSPAFGSQAVCLSQLQETVGPENLAAISLPSHCHVLMHSTQWLSAKSSHLHYRDRSVCCHTASSE